MTQEQITWLVVGIAAVALIVVVIAILAGRRRSRKRVEQHESAELLREDAARHRQRVADDDRAASVSRAEADEAEAQARRLRAEADEREKTAASSRSGLDAQLREADRLDPEVRTDRHGHRRDGTDPAEELAAGGADGAVAGPPAVQDGPSGPDTARVQDVGPVTPTDPLPAVTTPAAADPSTPASDGGASTRTGSRAVPASADVDAQQYAGTAESRSATEPSSGDDWALREGEQVVTDEETEDGGRRHP